MFTYYEAVPGQHLHTNSIFYLHAKHLSGVCLCGWMATKHLFTNTKNTSL